MRACVCVCYKEKLCEAYNQFRDKKISDRSWFIYYSLFLQKSQNE